MTAVSLPCTNCCGCNAIHDIAVGATIYVSGTGVGGPLNGTLGIGIGLTNLDPRQFVSGNSTGFLFRGAFTNTLGVVAGTNYSWFMPGGPSGTFTAPSVGDTLQITLRRSGADCSNFGGDYYADDFSGALDASWNQLLPATPSEFATTGGRLRRKLNTDGATSTLYQRINCQSDSATYTVNFCVNGSVKHTASWTGALSTSTDHYILAGVSADLSGSANITLEWDNFYVDFDT